MKIYELIELLQNCNQEATIKIMLDLSLSSTPTRHEIFVLPEDQSLQQTATEIQLIIAKGLNPTKH